MTYLIESDLQNLINHALTYTIATVVNGNFQTKNSNQKEAL